jgi:hypothetical protein
VVVMKFNQRQRELAESALQTPEWRGDRKASWIALGAGALLVGVLAGPMTALVCVIIAIASIILFSVEPFTGLLLLATAAGVGFATLESTEVLFAFGYLVFAGAVGLLWVFRNIKYESARAESLQEDE